MPNTLTFPLDPPVPHAGGTIAAVTLREPTAEEAMQCERNVVPGVVGFRSYRMALVVLCSGLGDDAVAALPISAFVDAEEFLLDLVRMDLPPMEAPPPELCIEFDAPIVSGGVTYSELRLAEPNTGHVRMAEMAMNGGDGPADLRNYRCVLVAKVSGVPHAVVRTLPASLVTRAAAYLQGFSRPGRRRGRSS